MSDPAGSPEDPTECPDPPGRPGNGPYVFTCQAGRKHAYCMCQRSARYPLCDGTHRTLTDEDVHPIKVVLEEERTVAWCACGKSANKPYCDGSHAAM